MLLIRNLLSSHWFCRQPESVQPSVVSIGNFDALHQGHRLLIEQNLKLAKQHNLESILLSFEPLPHELFTPENPPARLLKFSEKWDLLKPYQINKFCLLNFNKKLANMSAQDFVIEVLVKKLHAKYIVVGEDFCFGSKRLGNIALLSQLGEVYGFKTVALIKQKYQNKIISSSWIRELLRAGDFALANQLLTRCYSNTGKVIYGNQLGRELGCPTANIPMSRKSSPLHGVYIVEVEGADENNPAWPGVASLGTRPAVGGVSFLLEVHLFNFNKNIYGKKLKITYLKKLRDEWMFDNLEQLKNQIDRDCEQAKKYFETIGRKQ